MPIVLAGAAIVLGYLLISGKATFPNPLNPAKAPPAAPGPGAQGAKNVSPAGAVIQFSPPNFSLGVGTGSPNSTLATINGGLVVANNALGMFDQLNNYLGSGNSDSEYPVSGVTPPDAPVDNSVSVDDSDYVASNQGDDSYSG